MSLLSPQASPARNFAHLLWTASSTHALRPAVEERERALTHRELRDRAAAIARALLDAGLRPGDRVGILAERGIDAAAAIFGVLAAGGVVIVINERYRARQIEYALENSGASLLLASDELLGRQPRAIQTGARILELSRASSAGGGLGEVPLAEFQPIPRAGDDVAQIIYTSGSTGLPKGVVFTHGALWNAVQCVTGYLGLESSDRIASLLPFSSVYGVNQLLCAIGTGAALVIDHSPVSQQIATNLRARDVTVLAAVPPLWIQLLSAPAFAGAPIPSLRLLQNAGGHLPTDAVRRVRAAQPQADLYLQYGMTETFRSTFLPPEEVDHFPGSMGKPVPGAEIAVVREDGTSADFDEVGELVHAGPTLARGYWNNSSATERVFRPRPAALGEGPGHAVYSGDFVRRDADGRLFFVSRRDRMIKTLGFRVGPDEIMDVLYASGQVAEGLVSTEPCPQRGERIVAYVVLASGGSSASLEAFCRTELPRHMQPGRIEVRASIPRLASGKYDLDATRASTPTDTRSAATASLE